MRLVYASSRNSLRIAVVLSGVTAILGVVLFANSLFDELLHKSNDRAYLQKESAEAIKAFRLLKAKSIDEKSSILVFEAGWESVRSTAAVISKDALTYEMPKLSGIVAEDEAVFEGALLHILEKFADASARERITLAAIDAMARSFGNPHTFFIPPAIWQLNGGVPDDGIGLSTARQADGFLVWDVVPGSPAEEAGIRPGDVIKHSDLQPLVSAGRIDLVTPYHPISVVLRRGKTSYQVEVRRRPVQAPAVDWAFLPRNIAYVRVRTFSAYPGMKMEEAVRLLDVGLGVLGAYKPSGWVIDLRSNPGGSAHFAAYVGGALGISSPFLQHVSRAGTNDIDTPNVDIVTDGKPVVVLVDERTASSAEALAFVLKEQGIAHLIGQRTRGAVFGASYFEVGGGALQIATERAFVGADRRDLNGVGVAPHQTVLLQEEDLQSATYVGLLRGVVVAPKGARFDSQLQAAVDFIGER